MSQSHLTDSFEAIWTNSSMDLPILIFFSLLGEKNVFLEKKKKLLNYLFGAERRISHYFIISDWRTFVRLMEITILKIIIALGSLMICKSQNSDLSKNLTTSLSSWGNDMYRMFIWYYKLPTGGRDVSSGEELFSRRGKKASVDWFTLCLTVLINDE